MGLIASILARFRGSSTQQLRAFSSVVGRDAFCRRLAIAAGDSGCVLLFGGRQSGKSSILRRTVELLSDDAEDRGVLDLPVMLDLMRLPHDATPKHFFHFAAEQLSACARTKGLRGRYRVRRSLDLAGFEDVVRAIGRSATARPLRIILLIDEANRVLGERFPRGFLDNLFALLYGQNSSMPSCVAVFAGAQELYAFSADGTSPIGSRAARLSVTPIELADAEAVLTRNGRATTIPPDVIAKLHGLTGGHAGLLAYTGKIVARTGELKDVATAASDLRSDKMELFQIWAQALSAEARLIAEVLATRERVALGDGASVLSQAGLAAFRVERAWQELLFTGLAIRQGDELGSC